MPTHGSETTAAEGTAAVTKTDRKANDYWYDIWDKFTASEPRTARKASAAARKAKKAKNAAKDKDEQPEAAPTAAFGSWEKAAAECKAKVAAIVKECTRLNQKYRDLDFNLDSQTECLQSLSCKFPADNEDVTPSGVSRISDIYDSPRFNIDFDSPADVHQGMVGDCWFLSALTAVAAKRGLMDRLCVARNEEVGVYGFVFFRDGEWIPTTIDDKMLLRYADDDKIEIVRGYSRSKKEGVRIPADVDRLRDHLRTQGRRLYFSWSESQETWLPLIEKAYAKAHGDYKSLEGGWASEGIEDLTGGIATSFRPGDIMSKDRFWTEELMNVNKKYLFGGDSSLKASKGMVDNHAYAVLQAYEEGDLKLLKLRNPWGHSEWTGDWSDGSKLWTSDMLTKIGHTFGDDGVFWMTYQDFFKHFRRISRVRLFDDSWKLSQLWTSVEVPWTIHCLDTKFQFTIEKTSSVVLALTQPDSRYFRGLKGRIYCALHFCVQKEGGDEDEWIVRSMHRSGGSTEYTRSVCAEIQDLEPGTYDVLVTITATRYPDNPTAEEMVLKYAAGRKEKVLDVGRRFTYANEKGNRRAMEVAMKRRREEEERDAKLVTQKETRRTKQHERERARLRKLRIKAATGKPLEPFNQILRKRQADTPEQPSDSSSESSDDEPDTETVIVEDASESNTVGEHTPASEDSRSNAAPEETAVASSSTDATQDVEAEANKDESSKDGKASEAEKNEETRSDVKSESTVEEKKDELKDEQTPSTETVGADEEKTSAKPESQEATVDSTATEETNTSEIGGPTSQEQQPQQQPTEPTESKDMSDVGKSEAGAAAHTLESDLSVEKSEAGTTASKAEPETAELSTTETHAVSEGKNESELKTTMDQPSESKVSDTEAEPKSANEDTIESKATEGTNAEVKAAEGTTESKADGEDKTDSKSSEEAPAESKPDEEKTDETNSDEEQETSEDKVEEEEESNGKDGTEWYEEMLSKSKTKGTVVSDLSDEDFDWDSDLDGPIPLPDPSDSSDTSSSDSNSDADSDKAKESTSARRRRLRHRERRARTLTKAARGDIFPNDPWNAMCVIGLRVYSSTCEAKLSIIRGDGIDI